MLLIWVGATAVWAQDEMITLANPAFGEGNRPAVVFSHEAHSEEIDCEKCHHVYDDQGQNVWTDEEETACSSCHQTQGTQKGPDLKAAYHGLCIECHEKALEEHTPTAALMCGECHRHLPPEGGQAKNQQSLYAIYDFVSGPLTYIAFAIFFVGMLIRLVRFWQLSRVKDPAIHDGFRGGWAARSIFHWLLPLNVSAKESPWVTLVGFIFHGCLLLAALFLSAHVIMFDRAWGWNWPVLPDRIADILTWLAIGGAFFFAVRRLVIPHVRALTTAADWGVLALAVLPFITGLIAYHQWFNYSLMLILHIVCGNLLLMAIPMTKLSHMFFFFVSRAVTGSDFGKRQVGAW